MDARRKELGRRIRAAREAQGYRNQETFAAACGVSKRSITKLERGDAGVGQKVMDAAARTLGWPRESMTRFLSTGDATGLAPVLYVAPPLTGELRERRLWDETEDAIMRGALPDDEKWEIIFDRRARIAKGEHNSTSLPRTGQ